MSEETNKPAPEKEEKKAPKKTARKAKTPKKASAPEKVEQPKIPDKDNPSLAVVGDVVHLRVFEDFFCEKECCKWKAFDERIKALAKQLSLDDSSIESIASKIRRKKELLNHVEPEKKAEEEEAVKKLEEEYNALRKLHAVINDDRYAIQSRHEREVADAIVKSASVVFVKETKFQKLLRKLHLRKGPTPTPTEKVNTVEVAFEDLKNHVEIALNEDMVKTAATIKGLEKQLRDAGQYANADKVKAYAKVFASEQALVNAGYNKFVTEEQMIKFIRNSERGVRVDFLRYYDGVIPQDVIEKKIAADKTLLFDNFVVAFYSDVKKEAKKVEVEKKEKKAVAARATRRDPILFGIIKETRKLVYICDWVTETDDLTLDVLEKALGEKAKILVQGEIDAEGGSSGSVNETARIYRQINQAMLTRDQYSSYSNLYTYADPMDDASSTTLVWNGRQR